MLTLLLPLHRERLQQPGMSLISKFIVQGRDACAFLNRISCNDVDVEPGHIVYTPWVNERGGFEADLTVTRLAEDQFLVVVGENSHGHTAMRMRRHLREDKFVTILDATAATAQINIHGPKARALMSRVSSADLAMRRSFLAAREIDIGYATVLAIRITYVGELGWELHVPTIQAVQVYDMLVEAGREFGLRHAGAQTLSSLRFEKANRDFGIDLDNTDNPIEAGLGFTVRLDKPGLHRARRAGGHQAGGDPAKSHAPVPAHRPRAAALRQRDHPAGPSRCRVPAGRRLWPYARRQWVSGLRAWTSR